MWETISNIITADNALQTLMALIVLVLLFIMMAKSGMLKIRTKNIHIGDTTEKERIILREQTNAMRIYMHGLEYKINKMVDTSKCSGYLTKYIIEIMINEMTDWILFNNISKEYAYIKIKQDKICSLVLAEEVGDMFKTAKLLNQMRVWVKEVILKLIEIRNIYN